MEALQKEQQISEQISSQVQEKTRWGALAAAVVITFAAVTPGFTAGALADPLTMEFGVNTAIFGLVLSCFFACTAIGSLFAVRVADRLPPALQLAIAALIAGFVMVAIGNVSSIVACGLLLAVGGLSNSLVQPAVGRILSGMVSARRLSLASGVVQAAQGAATLPAALLLRFVAEPFGWRGAFFLGGVIVLLSAIVSLFARTGRTSENTKKQSNVSKIEGQNPANNRALLCWVVGAALGTVGVTGVASFFVPIATAHGFSAPTAGTLAMCVCALVAAVRIGLGLIADYRPQANITFVIAMMLVGMVGLIMTSFDGTLLYIIGLLLIVIGLFGWNGLLVGASLRLLAGSPARIAGGLQIGFFTGGTLAPVVFGVLVNAVGMSGALLTCSAFAGLGALAIFIGERFRSAHA